MDDPHVSVTSAGRWMLRRTSAEVLADALASIGFKLGDCLVFAACGHWWRESTPEGFQPTTPRVCSQCRPDNPAAVGVSPQGFAMVPVAYVPLIPDAEERGRDADG
jgi:hypothetical protein